MLVSPIVANRGKQLNDLDAFQDGELSSGGELQIFSSSRQNQRHRKESKCLEIKGVTGLTNKAKTTFLFVSKGSPFIDLAHK